MDKFSDEVAEMVFEESAAIEWKDFLIGWQSLKELAGLQSFVPSEPVVIHGPLPKDLPEFEGIDYPIGGKPEEKRK